MKIDLLKTIISPIPEGYICEIKSTLHETLCFIRVELKEDMYEWQISDVPKNQPYIPSNKPYVLATTSMEYIDTMCLNGITDTKIPSWVYGIPEFNTDFRGKMLARCIRFISKTLHLY